MMTASAREVALNCLLACEKQGAWSDGYLRSAIQRAGLDKRDAGLCSELSFGVLQHRLLLDWHIDRLSSIPTGRLEAGVRNCLRLGLYQLLCLDRVPNHAAVNEAVALAKKYSRNPRAAGLVNGVLRTFGREEEHPAPEELWLRYSHPKWLADTLGERLPEEEREALLKADNSAPGTCIQANTLKTSRDALLEELSQAGAQVKLHPWLPDCLELEGAGNLELLPAFQEGRFYVQDAAAKAAVLASGACPGMAVLDACAAPGGKTFAAMIQSECKADILSCDIHPNKVKQIRKGAERLGLSNVTAEVRDAKKFDPALESRFDLVIADVPCSGLGIIRKKPDIRYKDPKALEGLPKIQLEILENVSRYVKPGGALLYATCTLLERENEAVVAAFLETHDDFFRSSFLLPNGGEDRSWVTLWPHRDGTDGFFFAKMRRSLPGESKEKLRENMA